MVMKKYLLSLFALTSLILIDSSLVAGENPSLQTRVQKLSSSPSQTAMSLQLLLANRQIGEALYSYSQKNAQLSSLFVEEMYRGRGYGAKLFRLVCTMLKKNDCSKLTFNACAFEYARNDQAYYLRDLVTFFENLGASVVEYDDYVHGSPTTALMEIYL